jgi:hypothetical protein
MTINGSESLNNIFKEVRELPITSLVEITFYKLANILLREGQMLKQQFNNDSSSPPKSKPYWRRGY